MVKSNEKQPMLKRVLGGSMSALMLAAALAPAAAFAVEAPYTNGETSAANGAAATAVYLEADDSKIAVKVPTKVAVAVNADGTFTTPEASSTKIVNESIFKIHVESFKATPSAGFNFDSGDDLVTFDVTPNGVAAGKVAVKDYTTASKPADIANGSWDMAKSDSTGTGDEIALTTSGKIENVTKDLNAEQQFATLDWTFQAGAGA